MKINTTLVKIIVSLVIFVVPITVYSATSYQGKVVYANESQTPLPGVKVMLEDEKGNVKYTAYTNKFGEYEFKDILDHNYVLNADYDAAPSGVDFEDLYILFNHLIGEVELKGINFLAADVDANGVLDWNDYWHFLVDWYLNGEDFISGDWVFQKRNIKDVESGTKDMVSDQLACSGDGGGDYEPGGDEKNSTINSALYYKGSVAAVNNEIIDIPVYYSGSSSIGGFAINFVTSDRIIIEEVVSDKEALQYNIGSNELKVSWMNIASSININDNDSPLFTIRARVVSGDNGSVFTLGSESHLIDDSGRKVYGSEIVMPELQFDSSVNELKDIYPNPVSDRAKIGFELSEESDVIITIYSLNGQLIAVVFNEHKPSGFHEVDINVNSLGLSNGMYVYKMDVKGNENFTQSKMMIVNK